MTSESLVIWRRQRARSVHLYTRSDRHIGRVVEKEEGTAEPFVGPTRALKMGREVTSGAVIAARGREFRERRHAAATGQRNDRRAVHRGLVPPRAAVRATQRGPDHLHLDSGPGSASVMYQTSNRRASGLRKPDGRSACTLLDRPAGILGEKAWARTYDRCQTTDRVNRERKGRSLPRPLIVDWSSAFLRRFRPGKEPRGCPCLHPTRSGTKMPSFYELHVKAFFDSNDDGIGDFAGLIEKLDYLQELGITCIWLLPFYPSPLRDDGYDIADYHGVHPELRHAQAVPPVRPRGARRGHPGRDRAGDQPHVRPAPLVPGRAAAPRRARPKRELLRLERHRHASTPRRRIIFTDTETSNWTWDPVAKAYYWHRFFHHQPDLNYDNPLVLRAVIKVMRFWLDMGVDGMRLDAIPYLIEREGTNCENLPESHDDHQADPPRDRRALPGQDAPGRGQPVARRRAPLLRRRRRVPHGVPLPADAPDLHGPADRRTGTRSSRSCGRRPTSRPSASGRSSSGTTTS